MATVKVIVRGKSNPANLYVRFVNGRKTDVSSKTQLLVDPKHWDNSKCNYRNLKEIKNRVTLSTKFEKLKIHILEQSNEAFVSGDIIDKFWLNKSINEFFNRPTSADNSEKIKKHDVYYLEFAEYWIANDAKNWKVNNNKNLNDRAIKQYRSFIEIFKKFQDKNHYRIKDFNTNLLSDFVSFMEDNQGYGYETVKRHVGRLKFFLLRAENKGLKVAPSSRERVFVSKPKEPIMKPYLNEEEINNIFNLDLSDNDSLDNIRDNFIIGLWTGLRISDFNTNLDISNIDEDYINIKTLKTSTWVTIPLHPQVKQTLNKRLGNLPLKSSDKHFNESVKILCMYAGINEVMKGDKIDKVTNRNKRALYKKYELISSHTCRRSFATNLFGNVPNHIIQSVGGWSSEKMMLHYIKKTNKEYAKVLKDTWDNKYKTNQL